ncbi:hypothetical protein PACTADRAFT_15059 [Pachysolen tannophilus NRRL Y-2460]|uniref:Glycoside hydrolase family 92 protein n=1 Tax=Pachysolen tannophilus NRRL Y-2460 TaxID=669874 RepID=A0A1E4TXK7_PACTA|nr:hypothetical protein PACTADRAFT_15059 [Pachysolen tannophilus NRRL Y-2460]
MVYFGIPKLERVLTSFLYILSSKAGSSSSVSNSISISKSTSVTASYSSIIPRVTLGSDNFTNYVDVFYGTENGGNVFPGTSRPFGMAKMGIDVYGASAGDAYSGYAVDGYIYGISMMHESGTGGAPEYGVVAQLPLVGDVDVSTSVAQTKKTKDVATVGYYKVELENDVIIEFAAAERSGIYQYTFPSNSTPNIVVNATHHLYSKTRPWWTQYAVNGSIETPNNATDSYTGYTTIKGGWGDQGPWKIYFCGEFDTEPLDVSSFVGNNTDYTFYSNGSYSALTTVEDEQAGLIFTWDEGTTEIRSRVGISFISTDQACQNILDDFPDNSYNIWDVVEDTQYKWYDDVFGKISMDNSNETLTTLLYSALYGSHLLPSNRTGENPYWTSSEPYYDDWFTIWDTFRCLNPLFNVMDPTRGAELVRSLIDTYKNVGYMPDGRSANQNGRTQGGSNADIVLADAYIKGISQGVNWTEGYAAMVKDAEVTPPYWYDSFAPDASTKDGRGALPDWLKYGWITRNYTRSVTRTMEYAYDDFALSVVAQGLNNTSDYEKYLKRSANWQNIWNFNASTSAYNYTGFVQPKDANGEFNYTNYDPLSCGNCYWSNDEYEGKPVEYGWAVPHDIETLKSFIGDESVFIQRLDDMFGLYGDSLADIGNEPSFLTPYLYNYVNAQYRTVETIRYILNDQYSTGSTGLPGNSDAGAMQAWLFWGIIGLYPVSGTTTYLLSSPFVSNFTLELDNGNTFSVIADNLSETNIFVQNVTVNGDSWDKNWVSHDDVFTNGGEIYFVLGSDPVEWDVGDNPPSPGHYSL